MSADSTPSIDTVSYNIADMSLKEEDSRCLLLNLPAEIRLRLYYFLFACRRPIEIGIHADNRIFQPDDNLMYDKPNVPVRLSAQFLMTCKQIYHEGSSYMILYNKFEILDKFTQRLPSSNLTSSVRALMGNITFNNRSFTRLDLPAIGSCFTSLRTLEIATQGPGVSLSILAYEFAKSLPCSTIRDWPVLELHVKVPHSATALEHHKKEIGNADYYQLNQRVSDITKIQALFKDRTRFQLTDLEPYTMPVFRLGTEMPYIPRIVLKGRMSQEHTRAITRYENSYGDCAFEFVREEDCTNEQAGRRGSEEEEKKSTSSQTDQTKQSSESRPGYKTWIYIWKRKDQATAKAVRGKDLDDSAGLMRRWVPALGEEFVRAIAEAGL